MTPLELLPNSRNENMRALLKPAEKPPALLAAWCALLRMVLR
jgi:hypothetical protein